MEVAGKRVKAVLKDDHDGLGLRLRLDGEEEFPLVASPQPTGYFPPSSTSPWQNHQGQDETVLETRSMV